MIKFFFPHSLPNTHPVIIDIWCNNSAFSSSLLKKKKKQPKGYQYKYSEMNRMREILTKYHQSNYTFELFAAI